jgi:hypothetical protein
MVTATLYKTVMSRLPNQISSERADLLVQIARCRRLAYHVGDHETTGRLPALAIEYEKRLAQLDARA